MNRLPKTRQLQVFRQILRSGSIRAAARELGLAQPTVSRTIRDLEQTLGAQLFLRDSDGTRLTEAGEAFSQRAQLILEELLRASHEVEQINNYSHGVLNMGFSSLMLMTVLPTVTDAFLVRSPHVQMTVKEGQLSALLPMIRSGELDFAVGTIEPSSLVDDLITEPLMTASFSILCRRGHPLEQAQTLEQLGKAKWLLPESTMGYYRRLMVDFQAIYTRLPNLIRTDSLICALNMMLHADYLTVVASGTCDSAILSDRFTVIPINNVPSASYYIVWSEKMLLTAPAKLFIELLKKEVRRTQW
ncbi:LysR family transcriptional regulator [Enterobacteriaceae bacterium 4M9]|nr:LysR family transcriptional regulator [Enterobacteriaceae bacterium 4M9]